jgi:hypothetical protein
MVLEIVTALFDTRKTKMPDKTILDLALVDCSRIRFFPSARSDQIILKLT